MASSENVPGPSTPSNKDTSGGSDAGGKSGGIGTTPGSDSWNPLVNTNNVLPSSVSSPL